MGILKNKMRWDQDVVKQYVSGDTIDRVEEELVNNLHLSSRGNGMGISKSIFNKGNKFSFIQNVFLPSLRRARLQKKVKLFSVDC